MSTPTPITLKDMNTIINNEMNMNESNNNNIDNNTSNTTTSTTNNDNNNTNAQISESWIPDTNIQSQQCHNCKKQFTTIIRKHHCRLCGNIFCSNCTKYKCLIPPSSIVLNAYDNAIPNSRSATQNNNNNNNEMIMLTNDVPEREITYTRSNDSTLLYGRGLEERFKLAREPLRVCYNCLLSLKDIQPELRLCNSNAMRYNTIDPSHWKRLCNSPLAFTLGHEVRKAAYTLNNLLPLCKKMGAITDVFPSSFGITANNTNAVSTNPCSAAIRPELQNCNLPNLNNVNDDPIVRIPTKLLELAQGIAVLTTIKGGLGLGVEFGTGLVISRLDTNKWSAPCAIGTVGVSWGALVGAQISDHVFLLMNKRAVDLFASDDGSVQLGADVAVSLGPIGRQFEADVGVSSTSISSIYTYSLSKGLYAGISLDGKILFIRSDVNRNFYGMNVHAKDLLNGDIPTPPAAQPLYDALKRCSFYANSTNSAISGAAGTNFDAAIDNVCMPKQSSLSLQQRRYLHGSIPDNVSYSHDEDNTATTTTSATNYNNQLYDDGIIDNNNDANGNVSRRLEDCYDDDNICERQYI